MEGADLAKVAEDAVSPTVQAEACLRACAASDCSKFEKRLEHSPTLKSG
jgi:hypothetical protein